MANAYRDENKRPQPFAAKDFIVDWAQQYEQPPPTEAESQGLDTDNVLDVMERLMQAQAKRGIRAH